MGEDNVGHFSSVEQKLELEIWGRAQREAARGVR